MTLISNIETIKNDINNIRKELNYALHTVKTLESNLNEKKNLLLNTCPHTNKIRKREDGPYGERYWYCDCCKLEF